MRDHRPKILFVPYKLHFRYFLFALAERNDVTVLLPPEKNLPKKTRLKGVRICYKQFAIDKVKNFIGRELRTQKYVENFADIVDLQNPDVLITCEFYHWYTLQGLFYKKRKPGMQFFVVSETKQWPKNFVARQIKKLMFSYFKANRSHVDAMLVYTEQAREFLAKHMPSMKTVLAPAPIDTKLFTKDCEHEFYKENTLKILFNARYSPYKRHKDMFLAVSQLRGLGYKVEVTCISRDDKRLDDVMKLAHEAGVREVIQFRKAMALKDMPALYRAHDILILPSYNEAIGMVVPEAMSCGRATITSDTVGANIYVNDGVTGIIFKTGDIKSMVEALKKCCDKKTLEEMGDKAREYIIDNFSAERVVSDLENIIQVADI